MPPRRRAKISRPADRSASIDAVLSSQGRTLRATVEAIVGSPNSVRVTPWTAGSGCHCGLSIVLAKSVIESVIPLGPTVVCCGKALPVVTVVVRDRATVDVVDALPCLIAQSADVSRSALHALLAHRAVSAQQPRAPQKIESFFSEQARTVLATIQPVAGDSLSVTVTPWSPSAGSSCAYSFQLPKSSIEEVSPVGPVAICCGKALAVLLVVIEEGAQLDATALLTTLSAAALRSAQASVQRSKARPSRPRRSVTPFDTGDLRIGGGTSKLSDPSGAREYATNKETWHGGLRTRSWRST
jgi:hypothetical protein